MRRELYAALFVAGVVFAILYETIANNTSMAYTTLLITIHVIGYIYLFEEWRYYRSHNAILASFQFIGIPVVLLTLGNLIAPNGFQPGIIQFSLDIFGGIYATSSVASLILLLPIVSILRLTARYYDDRYSGFVLRNKRYGNLKFPLFIHIISIALLIVSSMFVFRYDVMTVGYIGFSLFQWVQKLIYPSISDRVYDARENRRRNQQSRRGYMSSILNNTPSRRRSDRPRSLGSSDTSSVSSTNSQTRTRSSGRSVSTAPSNGYREIPTRSRNDTRRPSTRSSGSQSSNQTRRSPSSVAEVDRGVEVNTRTKTRKVKSSKISDYLPKGNYDASDLKCIVCYDEFSTASSQNIVVCPNCKFPGHEIELMNWLNTSPRCPRCNKEIASRRKLKSGTVSESQYAKFIRKL